METPQGQEKEKLNPVLSAITYVFDAAYSVLLTYSQAVLLVIVLIVSAEVISRKFLGTSIRWSEEVALFLMVWMAFISMAIGVQKGLHIAFSMACCRRKLPGLWARWTFWSSWALAASWFTTARASS